MSTLHLIFVILALVFFALATLGVPGHPRFSFTNAGLFFLTLALTNFRFT